MVGRAEFDVRSALHDGKVCIDMSTIDPSVSERISEMVKATRAEFADAPVVKSKPAAIAGELGIYVGGDAETFDKIRPILAYMGSHIIHVGNNGKGLVMKICHNAMVAQIQNGVNETLTLAAKNGIDVDAFVKAISYGGGQNFYLDSKAAAIRDEDYACAFSVENMAKDLDICERLSKEWNFPMSDVANAKRIYDKAIAMGCAKEDFCATIKAIRV